MGAIATSIITVPGWSGVIGAVLAALMLAIAFIDYRKLIIPNELNAIACITGLAAAGIGTEASPPGEVLHALLRAGFMFALFYSFRTGYRAVRGWEGMGFGDVKLAAVSGIWLDWTFLPIVVEIAALSALAVALCARLRGRGFDSKARLPFGAFFAPAIWLCWLLASLQGA
jgi:leader peptidase (prepilin peptidase) / N-methyltransferase